MKCLLQFGELRPAVWDVDSTASLWSLSGSPGKPLPLMTHPLLTSAGKASGMQGPSCRGPPPTCLGSLLAPPTKGSSHTQPGAAPQSLHALTRLRFLQSPSSFSPAPNPAFAPGDPVGMPLPLAVVPQGARQEDPSWLAVPQSATAQSSPSVNQLARIRGLAHSDFMDE